MNRSNLSAFLASLDLFKKIPASQLTGLESRLTEKHFIKGDPIFLEGDSAKYVWFLKEGRIKAVKHLPQGRDLTVCALGPRNLFGTCCCFSAAQYPCNVIAETDVSVVNLPIQDFESLMRRHPDLAQEMIAYLSNRLRQAKDTRAWEQESVEKRILHVMFQLYQEFGEMLPFTRKAIAEMAGTTVETSIRTFRVFQKEGLVDTSRGKIRVKDPQALIARIEKNP